MPPEEAAVPSERPVAIAGAGRVARALGRLLAEGGARPMALYGRHRGRAAEAAAFVGPECGHGGLDDPLPAGCCLLIAVSDDAIAAVAEEFCPQAAQIHCALHTCGGRGPGELAPLRRRSIPCGMLHPLQTIARPEEALAALRRSAFGLCGDSAAVEWAQAWVLGWGGRPLVLGEDRLALYHAGAVMASNYVTALLDAAAGLLRAAGVEDGAALPALEPLATAAIANTARAGAAAALTGPIERGDAGTVKRHLEALRDAPPAVRELYRAAGRRALDLARRKGLSARAAATLRSLLESDGNPASPTNPAGARA